MVDATRSGCYKVSGTKISDFIDGIDIIDDNRPRMAKIEINIIAKQN